jgi:hypothetical protein
MNTVKKHYDINEKKHTHVVIVINDLSDEFVDALLLLKKHYASETQEFRELQKQCANNNDYNGARFFSDIAKENHSYYKAACYVAATARPDIAGDCKKLGRKDIPLESYQFCKNIISFSEVA